MSHTFLRALRPLAAALAGAVVAAGAPAALASSAPDPSRAVAAKSSRPLPLVIGHRGASGYRPEHTLPGYRLAARMGANFIEPDLVSTKDHVLVVRHEPQLGETTDVALHPEFAARRTTKVIDGTEVKDNWFVDDFTYAELRTLHAKERIPAIRQRNTLYDRRYHIPTFQQVIDVSKQLSRELHRTIGIYPETKHPTYFDSRGLSLEEPLVRALTRAGLNGPMAPVFVQSFETANLKELNRQLKVPLIQLMDAPALIPADVRAAGGTTTYGELATPAGLRSIADYADGVGPSKDYVLDRATLAPTPFVADAHRAGLLVHPYTFRNENTFLLPGAKNPVFPADDPRYGFAFKEYKAAFAAGVDGLFSDNPDTAVEARESFASR